ncbi:MAG: hypothetical protein Q9175_007178 [Cornicularia normoerica]
MNINRPSSASASVSSSKTLRPRTRRQTHEDHETPSLSATTSRWLDGPATSSTPSRAESPMHPSRPNRAERSRSTSRFLGVPGIPGSQSNTPTYATSFWESSWSSLQGLASNLIGGDSSRDSSPGRSPQRRRYPVEVPHGRNTSAPPAQWGPSGGERQVGLGNLENRRMLGQTRKRETLLAANGHITPDVSGRYKRRDSDERNHTSAPPREQDDRDALVYLHKVKPGDTLAGVMIKYSCQPNAFRKANRLWPNDSIQVRKTVVLPVDACAVKGRKIPEPDKPSERLGNGNTEESMPTSTAFQSPWADLHDGPKEKDTPLSSIPTSPSISVSLSTPEEPPWKHDAWVMIDGFADAVEIARLSHRTLGYFPRSRRKSLTLSDVETPPASLDLPIGSYQSSPPQGQKSKSRSSSGSYLSHQLQGPGGVGTMGRDVRSPGPAQDGLNKLFAMHLPNLAPRKSFESVNSSSSHGNGGIENVGGVIEGWMRKLATKAANSVQPPTPGGRSGVGDLIELSEDAFEIGDDSHAEDEDRRSTIRNVNAGSRVGAWSAEQELMLREHFPPKGKVVGESPRRGKSS